MFFFDVLPLCSDTTLYNFKQDLCQIPTQEKILTQVIVLDDASNEWKITDKFKIEIKKYNSTTIMQSPKSKILFIVL